jgi:hypothetical protein
MSLLAEYGARVPVDSLQRPYEWRRAVEIFEGNNMATLAAAINSYIDGLRVGYSYAAVLGIEFIGANGANSRVLLSYGYFIPQT